VTAKVSFNGQDLNPVRDIADHVSLSSLFNCQKTDGKNRPNLIKSSKNHPNQIRLNSHQLHQETLERVRRPPEAPPLSFDERRYRPKVSGRQHACDTFLKKSSQESVFLSFSALHSLIIRHFAGQTSPSCAIALRISQSALLEKGTRTGVI
jgi:hypothetical protein